MFASLRFLAIFISFFFVVACGDDGSAADAASDTSTTVDSSADSAMDVGADAPADAAGDSSGDCDSAMEGEPCAMEGAFCGGPCTDVCSFCNVLECRDGTWGRVEVFPAPCFACGPELRCETGAKYCSHTISGVPGGEDNYACADPPAACSDDLTCECLGTAGVPGDCEEPNPGEVTVSLAAP